MGRKPQALGSLSRLVPGRGPHCSPACWELPLFLFYRRGSGGGHAQLHGLVVELDVSLASGGHPAPASRTLSLSPWSRSPTQATAPPPPWGPLGLHTRAQAGGGVEPLLLVVGLGVFL